MKQSYFTSPGFTFRLQPFGTPTALFLLFFLLNISFGFGQQPNYTHNLPEARNLDYFTLTAGDVFNPQAKIDRLIISVDVNSEGERFVLTFGNGIKKVGENDGLIDFITNQNDRLSNPLDFAINSEGKFYVATNESNRRFIRVYSAEGVYLPNEELGNGEYDTSGADRFKGPVGLTFDNEDNLYVADHYIGDADPPPSRPSSIKIYRKDNTGNYKNNLINEFDNVQGTVLNSPYRLAVNSDGHLYMAELGQNNNASVKILEFDNNFNPTQIGVISGNQIAAPGSIIIDKFDNIFIADFGPDINLARVLEATDDIDEFYEVFELIKQGIEDNIFNINIYNPDNSFHSKISSQIDFPVDLAISNCGTLYVNNAIFEGRIITLFGQRVPDISIDFDLEVYQRSPGYDTEDPVTISCPEDQEENLNNGSFNLLDYRDLAEFTDNCDNNLEIVQDPPEGFTITETTEVSIFAIDESGNESEPCIFEVIINEEPDTPPEFVNCPQEIIEIDADSGECGAILDFETPEAVDDNGNPTVTQISGPENGDFINVENGTVELVFQADDGVNDPVNCTVQIKIIDSENPVILDCSPENIEFTIQEGETYPLPDYTDQVTVEDNCDTGLEPVQDPPPGTPIDADEVVTLTATDEAGNVSNVCSFTVKINVEETYEFQCIEEYTVRLGEGAQNSGVEEIATSEFIISETSNLDFELTNQQFTCDDIGTNPLTIRATNRETGESYSCEVDVTVIDVGAPLIICPAETITTNLPEEGYKVPNFFENRISDNCDNIEDLDLVQDIPEGTILDSAGTYTINLTATDSYDNEETCRITLILEEDDPNAPEIECVTHELFLDQNGQATLDPEDIFSGERGNLELSVDIENFDCSNLGQNTVILTATDPDTGLSDTCVTEVMISDDILPVANCVAPGREFRLQNGSVTISPSAIDLNSEDNCELTRTLSEDTFTIPGTKNIILYVEDVAGNTDQCPTTIEILPEDTNRVYRCIEEEDIPDIRLDEDCELNIPDYARLIETENFNAAITQTYEALTEDTYLITVEIRDDDTDEFVGDCEFSVNIVDLIPPGISCPNDQIENFDPDTGFEVPNYENMAGISDNCGEVSFRQEPAAGEIIYNNTTVNLFVEDEGGLEASCSFELELTEADVLNISCLIDKNVNPDDNCSFWLPDYTSNADVNFPGADITQTPPVGTILTESTQIKLTASLNGETDECYFMVNLIDDQDPVANCVSGYVVNLDNNGTASITPEDLDNNSTDNCGIVSMALSQVDFTTADIGDVPITLTVRDDAGNIDYCETTVEVRDEASGEFECRENIEVFLDENGEANLNIQELYTGDASGLNLEASRLNFTCEDLGVAFIQLDYSGDETGSCTINVDVQDELPPEINTNLVELTLDNEGFAYLEESDILAEDNCSEELIYRFSKSVFTCKDVGMNSVNVEVEDINGNRSDKNIQVRISGEGCDLPEPGENEYLFIYPNPNNGIFTIVTPEGMFVEQVRVFDSRGRYIMQQDYSANARFYRMTIQGVEESVYTLQIFTNEGVIVKRAIIKR
ncbi:Por secretion system C-terminal sorting domain-containing protein [Salegentibacter agarivorans]|uniref:Por secretion system C-terminal sorting domain-containing protein n=1 Tax=Salegentibacter agarivorans TaxID=345907 RepID=A0A1I2L5T4_9FLAO|nr:T9SS type A sorting domain-containing protein [Salegentibacter agarivorans]SFF72476.1 Por secretion system C-terminal sorting domain-containing protein [Salegentibacter agarivorans]